MPFFTPAPTPPSTSDPASFNTRADAFLAWMATFATQSEAYGAFLAAANMFGVVIPYIFDATTTDADPGAGKLRLSSATQNLSTTMRADLADSQGGDATSLLTWMATGTSIVKGMARLMKAGDSRVWIYAEVTALATPTGYRNITVNVISASSANPFANGDAIILAFVPKGDKGDPGTTVWSSAGSTTTIPGAAASATITLPAGYGDLTLKCTALAGSGSSILISGSTNGSTFVGSFSVVMPFTGALTLIDYLDTSVQMVNADANGTVTGGLFAGPLVAIRLTPNTGTFSGGSIRPRGH